MSSKTYSLGLIGFPLGHSLSPKIHETALNALGIKGAYILYPVSPDTSPKPFREREAQLTLKGLLAKMRAGEIHGLNVTIPHKQNVIPLLDELTSAAQAIGAVNTIFIKNNVLIGDNTDAPGFWRDLQQLEISRAAQSQSALVLGAGGSARAVVYALITHGYQVRIAARRVEQAQELCSQFSWAKHADPKQDRPLAAIQMSQSALRDLPSPITLIINTTPVGMHPDINSSPWPLNTPLPKNAAVYDLVYNPQETQLVKRARENGLPATSGLGMLIEQAALAFERWVGVEAPRTVMMQAVVD